jgi:hypothetical protein
MRRFVLLEHTGHPDDPVGRHYDLLLEEGDSCRTWRLAEIPVAGGGSVAADPLPPHRLEWLDRLEGEVSGGRGVARRVATGTYEEIATSAEAPLRLRLRGGPLHGALVLEPTPAGLRARLEHGGSSSQPG